MAAKLSVIFFITLCLIVGVELIIYPWVNPLGLNDWGENFILVYAAHKTGWWGLQRVVASGWVRGAVTGLGIINIVIAFWEIAHFNQTVSYLQGKLNPLAANRDVAQTANAHQLSHHERGDDNSQHSG